MKKTKKAGLLAILPTIAMGFGLFTGLSVSNQNLTSTSKNFDATSQTTQSGSTSTGQNTTSKTQYSLSGEVNKQYRASNFYSQNDMPVITNSNGPVLLGDNGRSISAYDWYGNPSWFLNLNESSNGKATGAEASYYKYSNASSAQIPWDKVGTKIVDIAYLPFKDFLYVLTDTSYLFLIESKTGVINSVKELKPNNNGFKINKIAFIDFNNSLYGWDSTKNNQGIYSIDTQKLTLTQVTNSGGSSGISGKYIYDILPLDIGYNVAIYSESSIDSSSTTTTSNAKLKLLLVDDNGNKFTSSASSKNQNGNGITSEMNLDLSGAKISKPSDLYTGIVKRDGSNILLVGNKIFNITLNKSAMENSKVQEINNTTSFTTTQLTINNINSSFVDEKGIVYFKDNSEKIYQISLNNTISVAMTIKTSNGIFNSTNANDAKIYPVLKSQSSSISRAGTGYLATPQGFICTGFTNGSILSQNFNSSVEYPQFVLNNYKNQAPSAIQLSSFRTQNSSTSTLNSSNTEMYADDISGELFVKTILVKPSWYDKSLNANTYSTVIGKWNCSPIKNVTKWASQAAFNTINGGYFRKRSPDQISDADVTKYYDQILVLPQTVISSEHKVDIIVTERKGNSGSNSGTIKLKANVQYTNKQGTRVSYLMDEFTYNVKAESNIYKFKFCGGLENQATSGPVDIATLGPDFENFKNTLPSLIRPTSDNLDPFIEIQDKYPTDTRRVITITDLDDSKGEVTIQVHYNNLEVGTPSTFSIKYTGLATENTNKINFAGEEVTEKPTLNGKPVFSDDSVKSITSIPQYKDYDQKLATQVDESQLNFVFESNLKKMGFQPQLKISKTKDGKLDSKDAEYGSIKVELDYKESYSDMLGIKLPSTYWNKFGLENGVATQRYIGFLPIGETYGVRLKAYKSKEIQDIVNNNNVNATIDPKLLLGTLEVKGYNDSTELTNGDKGNPYENVDIVRFGWDGEDLLFTVHAQSSIYPTVNQTSNFKISWSPKFAAIRERNLIIASTTSVAGVGIVGGAIATYIFRRGKIRKLLK